MSWSALQTSLAAVLGAAVLGGCGTPALQPALPPPTVPNVEAARSGAEHEQIAAWYEREARDAEERAVAHRRLLTIYASPYPDYGNSGFIGHCRALIQRYEEAAEANRALAALHRAAAKSAR